MAVSMTNKFAERAAKSQAMLMVVNKWQSLTERHDSITAAGRPSRPSLGTRVHPTSDPSELSATAGGRPSLGTRVHPDGPLEPSAAGDLDEDHLDGADLDTSRPGSDSGALRRGPG